MEVSESVLNWLKDSNVLKFSPSIENNKIYLHEQDSQSFESGLQIVPLIKKLTQAVMFSDRLPTPYKDLNTLKDTNSAAAKLYNWNIIIKALENLEISVDSDMKALILAGDRGIISEILKTMQKNDGNSEVLRKRKKNKLLGEGALLLDDLDITMAVSQSENTLEFLILSLCKAFSVNTKTAAGLLIQSGKFLAQVLSKGLKGKIDPILSWYELVSNNSFILSELIHKERNMGSSNLVLGSLKGGLLSKSFQVVQKCCECLVSVHQVLINKDIDPWDWFSSNAFTIALKAYDLYKEDVTTFILKLFVSYGKDNLKQVFGQMLISNYNEPVQCFHVISSFWGYIDEESSAYLDIQTQGLVDYWIEYGLREAENEMNSINSTKVSALGFLCDVWCKFAKYVEKHEDSANSILTVIKRACREKSKILKIICYGRLFLLLSEFSRTKNSYAPIVYKTLTFALVENYANDRVREFLLNNFLFAMQEIQTLPVSVMLEPYIKQTQVITTPKYNTPDFDFYVAVARHSKLTVKDAVLVVDNLGKIYFSDYIFGNSAEIPLVLILGRFIDSRPMQEYITKFISLGLKIIYSKLSPKPKIPVKENLTKEEQEKEKLLSYYKKIVFSLTEKIIHLGNPFVNSELKEILIKTSVEIKNYTGETIKGLKVLLDLLTNTSSIIEKYENNRNAVSSSENTFSYANSILSSNLNNRKRSFISHSRERALSDIEKVKKIRMDKEFRDKSQLEMRKIIEEKKKKSLKIQLDQKKIALGALGSSQPIVLKEPLIINDQAFYSIDEETKPDQEIIWSLIKKYYRVLRTLFYNYASSGYKKDNFNIKAPFESISDKKTSISEGEFVKMMRDQGITNSFITTEEIRKLISWMLQKFKIKSIGYDSFTSLVYYVSELIFTRYPFGYNQFPPGVCLLALFEYFKKNPSKTIPKTWFDEPDYGVGDRDIIKMLNFQLKTDPNLQIPEGYKKFNEKEVIISYSIPKTLAIPESKRISFEIFDSILYLALEIHFLSPIVSLIPVTVIKGVLTKPKIELEDKIKDHGVPINKAVYKTQPLPTYLSFTPNIKLEVAKLVGVYNNDMLLECARLVDDLIYSVHSNSFELISRNPKPAGSIQNKALQQKIFEEAAAAAETQKNEAKRKLRKILVEEKLKQLRGWKIDKLKEEEELKTKEKELEELKNKQKTELKNKEKFEIEKKIKEFKIRKEEEENKKIMIERENFLKIEAKKKKEREEFLREAKKKLMENMARKTEEKKNSLAKNFEEKTKDEQKKDQRKLLISKLLKNKVVIIKEKNLKEQVYIAMIDPGVINLFKSYNSAIEVLFAYYCKQAPLPNSDSSSMSLAGFTKFVNQFPIVPSLTTSDQVLRIYKGITKAKFNDSGINSSEFKEALINIALGALKVLEKEAGKKLESYVDLVKEFIDWINLPQDPKKISDFLKMLNENLPTMNPRDKKRNKNTLIRTLTKT